MAVILSKAGYFVAIIFLGYFLRRIGLFKKEEFNVFAKIVLRITLPASIVYAYSSKEIDVSLFSLSVLGLACGIGYISIGYLLGISRGKKQQAFYILNISGFNIGNFMMPFAQEFLGASGIVTASLFDTGNAFICLGTAYSIAAMVQRGEKFSIIRILRDLIRSVPFDTYIIMATMTLLHIPVPTPVRDFAGILSNANAPMAMLMVGVGFSIAGERSQLFDVVRILSVRYAIAAVLSLCFFFVLPFDLEIRKTLAILAFSPIASAAPAFTAELDGNVGLSSAVNSISIILGIICSVVVLLMIA